MAEEHLAKKDRPRYHHGDLRRALLRVARAEISRHGAQTVSLTSLARLAGVSQPAPYRHFPDRASLLEAVAAEAFDELADTLTDAITHHEPRAALASIARAYLAFGDANIEIYRLMFASRLTPEAQTGSDLDAASTKAFELLRTAVTTIAPANADDDAYLLWAQMHGLVMLKADGFITRPLDSFTEMLFRFRDASLTSC
ncbi:TetR/AcrR family transcriptional regulator [Lichenicoccus sp.]|uniref:TetR/AcrR family transcriptional regulator n=1 Tax=Lichenicoccus sp. TaxID=2781899 RepID=UPI003D1083BD